MHSQTNCHCRHSEVQVENVWRRLSSLLVIFLSYILYILACDVIPEFSAYCFTICHLLSICQLYTISHGKGTTSIEVQAAAASLFSPFDDAHTWYKCPQTPLILHTYMYIRHLCNPPSENPGYGPAWYYFTIIFPRFTLFGVGPWIRPISYAMVTQVNSDMAKSWFAVILVMRLRRTWWANLYHQVQMVLHTM